MRAAGYRAARAYTGGPWNSIRDRWRLKAVPMTENMKRFAQVVDPSAAAELPATAKPSPRPGAAKGAPAKPRPGR